MNPAQIFRLTPFITLYSFSHLIVDAACAFLLFGVLELNDYIICSLILYNASAVTLIAILRVIPTYKGLSFGLASLALFIGSIPTIIGKDLWLKNDWVVFLFILLASMILFSGLRFMGSTKSKS